METTKPSSEDGLDLTSYQEMVFGQLNEVDKAVDRYSESKKIEGIWTLQFMDDRKWKLMHRKKFSKKSRHKLKNRTKHFIKLYYTVEWNTDRVIDGCKVVKLKGK